MQQFARDVMQPPTARSSAFSADDGLLLPPGDRSGFTERKLIVRHGKWSLIGKFTNLAVAFVNTSIVARLLAPADFADLNSLRTLMTLLAIGMASGLAQWSLRQLGSLQTTDSRSLQRQIVGLSLRAFAFICVPGFMVAFLSFWLSADYTLRGEMPLFQVLIASFGAVIVGASELLSEIHRGLQRPDKANLYGGVKGAPAATAVFISLTGGLAALTTLDFRTANSAYVLATLLICCSAGISLKRILSRVETNPGEPVNAPVHVFSEIIVASGTTSILLILSFLLLNGDMLFAGLIPNAAESSSYAGAKRCVQLISIPLLVVNTMASGIIVPLLSTNQRQLLGRVLRGFCGLAMLPAIGLGMAFLLAPEFSLNTILGSGYSASALALRILSIGQLVSVATGSSGTVLMLTGNNRVMLILNIMAILVFICTGPFLAVNYGALGLSACVTALYTVHNLASWYAVKRITGLNTFFSFRDTSHLRSYLSTAQSSMKSD